VNKTNYYKIKDHKIIQYIFKDIYSKYEHIVVTTFGRWVINQYCIKKIVWLYFIGCGSRNNCRSIIFVCSQKIMLAESCYGFNSILLYHCDALLTIVDN